MAAPTPENFVFTQADDSRRHNGVVSALSDSGRADSPRPTDGVTVQCEPVLTQFVNGARRFVRCVVALPLSRLRFLRMRDKWKIINVQRNDKALLV